jgi:hypothetical protein
MAIAQAKKSTNFFFYKHVIILFNEMKEAIAFGVSLFLSLSLYITCKCEGSSRW